LDYAEDAMIGQQPLESLTIEETFQIDDMIFSLMAIVYFQGLHYTIHVRGAYHPHLLPNFNPEWFYHDDIKDGYLKGKFIKGFLFQNHYT